MDEVAASLRHGGPPSPRCGMAEAEDGLAVPSKSMAGSIQGQDPLHDSTARQPVPRHEEIQHWL